MNRSEINILFADDDPDDYGLVREAVSEISDSLTVFHVNHAHDVFTYVAARRPDLILLDLNMPGYNGFECLNILTTHPETKAIPVIVYSTTSERKAVEQCYALGAARYFLKPVTYKRIVNGLEMLVTMHKVGAIVRNNFDDFLIDMGPLKQLA